MAGIYTIPTQNALQTTLGGNLALGETGSLTLAADWSTQLATASATRPFILVIDRVDSSGAKTPTKREYIKCTGISGTTVSGLTRGQDGSSDQAHSAGAIVELIWDRATAQSIADAFDVEHVLGTGVHDSALVTTLKATGAVVTTGTSDVTIVTPKALSDANIKDISSGWVADTNTWVYVSATSFKITGADVTAKFQPGTKVKWTQTSAKYSYVASSAFSTDTTVTLIPTTAYSVANAVITSPFYSYASPADFPQWFPASAPTYSGLDNGSGGAPTTTDFRYNVTGRLVTAHIMGSGTKAGTDAGWDITNTILAPANTSDNSGVGVANGFNSTGGASFVMAVKFISPKFYFSATANITDNHVISSWGSTFSWEI